MGAQRTHGIERTKITFRSREGVAEAVQSLCDPACQWHTLWKMILHAQSADTRITILEGSSFRRKDVILLHRNTTAIIDAELTHPAIRTGILSEETGRRRLRLTDDETYLSLSH